MNATPNTRGNHALRWVVGVGLVFVVVVAGALKAASVRREADWEAAVVQWIDAEAAFTDAYCQWRAGFPGFDHDDARIQIEVELANADVAEESNWFGLAGTRGRHVLIDLLGDQPFKSRSDLMAFGYVSLVQSWQFYGADGWVEIQGLPPDAAELLAASLRGPFREIGVDVVIGDGRR